MLNQFLNWDNSILLKERSPKRHENGQLVLYRSAQEQLSHGEKQRWSYGGANHRVVCACLYSWISKQQQCQLLMNKEEMYKEVFSEKQLTLWVTSRFVGRVISCAMLYRWSRQHSVDGKRIQFVTLNHIDDLRYGLEAQIISWWNPYKAAMPEHADDEFYKDICDEWLVADEHDPDNIQDLMGQNSGIL